MSNHLKQTSADNLFHLHTFIYPPPPHTHTPPPNSNFHNYSVSSRPNSKPVLSWKQNSASRWRHTERTAHGSGSSPNFAPGGDSAPGPQAVSAGPCGGRSTAGVQVTGVEPCTPTGSLRSSREALWSQVAIFLDPQENSGSGPTV